MGAHTQTLLDICSAPTALPRGEARRDSYHHMTGSLSLVREDVEKRAPTGVVSALGEMTVLRHVCHIEVFNTDVPVPPGIVLGGLDVEVTRLTADFQMLLGDLARGLAAAMAALLAAVTDVVCLRQSLLPTAIVPRVLNDRALTVRQKHLQPHTQPDVSMFTRGLRRLRRRSCKLMNAAVLILRRRLTHDQDMPLPIGARDEMRGHGRAFQWAVELDLHQRAQLGGNMKVCAVVVEPSVATRRVLAQRNGVPAVGGLEAGTPTGRPRSFIWT